MGFTFSYPCEQNAINNGVLQRWTKGFDVKGVEGHDVVPLFEAALKKHNVPIKVTAVVNDTTGTLIASNYADPATQIGCIFGTGRKLIQTPSDSGCNAAYMENAGSIPKLADLNLAPDLPMAINCEWFFGEVVLLILGAHSTTNTKCFRERSMISRLTKTHLDPASRLSRR